MLKGYKKRLLISVSILLGGIIILSTVIILLNSDIKKREFEITSFKQELALRDRTLEFLGNSSFNFQKVDEAIIILESIVPSKDDLINFPKELTSIGRKHTVDVGFKFGNEVAGKEGAPGSIQFNMTLTGEYSNLTDFLEEIESHSYAIVFSSIDVKRLESGRFSLLTNGLIYTK